MSGQSATIVNGDSKIVLKGLPSDSIDAIITDPPYEIAFMSRKWDNTGIAFDVDLWRECLRVLKPGGHILVFGSPRTYHRMAVAVEDAGFDVRDMIHWTYSSGFPKGVNVSKAIDKRLGAERPVIGRAKGVGAKDQHSLGNRHNSEYDATVSATDEARQWDGWNSAIKPSHEPIVVARKPFEGRLVDNVLRHGTGAYNIDATRVGTAGGTYPNEGSVTAYGDGLNGPCEIVHINKGRWTPNTIVSHAEGCGTSKPHGDEVVDVCADDCPVAELGQSARSFPTFIYSAKAPTSERPEVDGVRHQTVKPLKLMRHLVRLVTPPGGTVLDPFAGSGTTIQAALDEGFNAIGIELEASHIPLIMERLTGYEVGRVPCSGIRRDF